jgi:outer membrane receptor protein involved in Fe transport
MARVTGVSVNDGKYVFVRGLGERYSNTLMNGVTLPSADPDKKAVQMDLFPTDLLDSIVTTKSFTPDKPGDFAGGSVNLKTRSFPELMSFSVATSMGYNPQSNLKDSFLSYDGGKRDWLGFDDGTRELPEGIPTNPKDYPSSTFADGAPQFFDRITRLFSPVLTPKMQRSGLNSGLSVDFGNTYYFGVNNMLGVISSFSYDLGYDHYENGINARYKRDDIQNETLAFRQLYRDTRSVMTANLGGLLSLAYQPDGNNEYNLVLTTTHSGEDEARFQQGPTDSSGSAVNQEDQIRSLIFTERSLHSAQLRGEHFFEGNEWRMDWSLTAATSSQEDPDARYSNNEIDTESGIKSLVKPARAPRRVFRDLSEDQLSYNFNLEIPFMQKGDLERSIKLGGVFSSKHRDFNEQVFQYTYVTLGNSIFSDFEDMESFLDEEKIGINGEGPFMKRFISYFRGQRYEGDEDISAAYAMMDYDLNDSWRFIGGVRIEKTDLRVKSLTDVDTSFFSPEGSIDDTQTLPAAQLVYRLSENQSLRASWSSTIARPTFREIAPYRSFPFIGGDEYLGNQHLVLTEIDNFDLRWEWYPRPEEIVSLSLFRKNLSNPIEVLIEESSNNYLERPYNVDSGEIQGIEFEFRKNLGFMADWLNDFNINANLTYAASEVDNSNQEFISKVPFFENSESVEQLRTLIAELTETYGIDTQIWPREPLTAIAPNTPRRRDLFGQPDWIANASLSYDNQRSGTSVILNYNYVGDKLAFASQGATPDVYDAARGKLDLILKQNIGNNWAIKLSAKNLSDSARERYYDSLVKDIHTRYRSGRAFSLSATYRFE